MNHEIKGITNLELKLFKNFKNHQNSLKSIIKVKQRTQNVSVAMRRKTKDMVTIKTSNMVNNGMNTKLLPNKF